jgi:hypothetical protein
MDYRITKFRKKKLIISILLRLERLFFIFGADLLDFLQL